MKLLMTLIVFITISAYGFSQTIWYVDAGNVTGPWIGSQQNPFQVIQHGIDAAIHGDTVLVMPGTYVEQINFLEKSITVKSDQGSGVTTIDGNQDMGSPQAGRVVTIITGQDQVLDGFTITNGLSNGPGAGIYIWNASPRITNNLITKNYASGYGNGIAIHSGYPVIENNIIRDNYISGHYKTGGGLSSNSCATIKGNWIEDNPGGGIRSEHFELIVGNWIVGNVGVDQGGGIYCKGQATILNNVIAYNSLIEGNPKNYLCGAGIYCWYGAFITIENNVIAFNDTTEPNEPGEGWGGGIHIAGATAYLLNNTLYGNSASHTAGAIRFDSTSNTTVVNTICYDNSAPEGGELYIAATADPKISFSDIDPDKTFIEPGSPFEWGPGMIDADPLFVPGPDGDFYLSPSSPCIDAGNAPAINLAMHTCWTDPGETPDSGIVDMGFHYGSYTPPTLKTDIWQVSAVAGGTVTFSIASGEGNDYRTYLLLGSVTGIDPGTPLPGGLTILPLNWDVFTNLVLSFLNSPVFVDFLGTLDHLGNATARLEIPEQLTGIPAYPFAMYYACCCTSPFDFVSNPNRVEIVP